MTPLLTICVPTFNREEDLRRLIDNLTGEIGAREDVAVLVSDNASGDGTSELLRSAAAELPWLEAHRQPENLGAMGNIRWLAENAAPTEYLWIFCDDDLLLPGSLGTVLTLLRERRPGWLFLPHRWTIGASPAPGRVEEYETAREMYLAYHHWLTFATASILRADRLRAAVRDVDTENAYGPMLWYFEAGLQGPCVVAPDHAILGSLEISWADRAHVILTDHFTGLYDAGLHKGMSAEEFGSTLDGLYTNGFALNHWRLMPVEMLMDRVTRFPQSVGLRLYLWTIARERSLREPLAAIEQAVRSVGADVAARDLIEEGEAAFAAERLDLAVERFLSAAQLDPTLVTAWNDMSVALHALGRGDEALVAVENALFVDPEHEDARANLDQITGAPVASPARAGPSSAPRRSAAPSSARPARSWPDQTIA